MKRIALLLAVVGTLLALVWAVRVAPTSPLAGLQRPDPQSAKFRARVEERLEAGSYHYLRVTPDGQPPRWLVATRDAQPGQWLDVEVFGIAPRFASARLSRTFSPLSFATIHPRQEQP